MLFGSCASLLLPSGVIFTPCTHVVRDYPFTVVAMSVGMGRALEAVLFCHLSNSHNVTVVPPQLNATTRQHDNPDICS